MHPYCLVIHTRCFLLRYHYVFFDEIPMNDRFKYLLQSVCDRLHLLNIQIYVQGSATRYQFFRHKRTDGIYGHKERKRERRRQCKWSRLQYIRSILIYSVAGGGVPESVICVITCETLLQLFTVDGVSLLLYYHVVEQLILKVNRDTSIDTILILKIVMIVVDQHMTCESNITLNIVRML